MNELELYDIYGMWHVPFWQRTWFTALYLSCLCILLAVAGLFLWRYYAHRKKQKVPYWAFLERDLEQLLLVAQSPTMHKAQVYTRLTYLLKGYVERRYNVPAVGKTDGEMATVLDQLPLDVHASETIKNIFKAGVCIKFGQEHIEQKDIVYHITCAQEFVKHTTRPNTSDTQHR